MKKSQNAPRPSNDIGTDVQYISTINRSSGLQYSSESCGRKQKHVENNGHINKLFFFRRILFEENQNAPRPSERPPVRGEKMSNDINTDVQCI